YRYEMRERDVQSIDVVTGSDGRATVHVPMSDDVTYRFIVSAKDEAGATETATGWFSKGWYDQWSPEDSRGISFEPTTPRDDKPGYALEEEASFSFVEGGKRMPDAPAPAFLYVEASRGIRAVSVSNRSTYTFRYREDLIPNMTLYGVSFGPSGFQEASYTASLDTAGRKLKVMVTSDPASSVPSGKVTATIDVRDQAGNPVKDARVAFGAVDESLLAASSMGDGVETPLSWLYGWVADGILANRRSHLSLGEDLWSAGGGGAEMGGGGMDAVRRTFKDTATFEVVTTDGNGQATVAFTAPDNITSWRLSAVAVTKGLSAGYGRASLAVTKPVFVDAVVPVTLLATDAPVLKIRAYGIGLTPGEPLTFRVDAPTLGITNATVTGTAGTSAYVAIDQLPVGTHNVVLRVEARGGSDALLRTVTVVPSRFTKDEYVSTELAPGAALPDIGTSPEVTVWFESLAQSRYLPRLESLADAWNVRAESLIAERVSRDLLMRIFGRTDVAAIAPLTRYQQTGGGIAPLPYASEDVELSAKAVATDADAFDRGRLAAYFWGIADDAKVTREEALRALSGLAALGEPVLVRLRTFVDADDLTWRERLALGRGLEASGDREAARGILEVLLATSEERDGQVRLTVSEDRREMLEATAEVAALAASLSHPKAAGLDAYLETNWSDEALTDLDRAYYLAHVIPTLATGDVTVRYVAGGDEQTVSLVDGRTESVLLTAAEAKVFRATSVDGPATATFVRRTATTPVSVPEVGLTRSYLVPGAASLDALTEGMTVTVTLTPTWKSNAQDGCYVVRDHLPSGLAPLVTLAFGNMYGDRATNWYPMSVGTQDISFVVCKGETEPIAYKARVVSRGTYTAEPAILQSLATPAVTAVTDSKTLRIR
ncbi:MAG: alpha-2-macroglobulin family protein, partial [Patescibacteria group bacterium]